MELTKRGEISHWKYQLVEKGETLGYREVNGLYANFGLYLLFFMFFVLKYSPKVEDSLKHFFLLFLASVVVLC